MSQELVYQTIKKFQDKLLDLSARNKLLNFKFSEKARTQIRIINDSPDRIYKRLNEGKKLGLQTLPEPDSTPPDENSEQFQQMLIEMRSTDEQYQSAITNDDESPEQLQAIERLLRDKVRDRLKLPRLLGSEVSPTPQQQAQGLGINPAYDLPSVIEDGMGKSMHLQTLLFPKEFERKASGLLAGARTSIQETGRNTLYLAFGMLEWFESESSDVRFISPLLLYPVSIERESVKGQYRYFISAHEDEVEVNPCLRERLKRDFGIELPDFQEASSPDAYFREVAQLIEGVNRWQVRRFVTLSLFSFGNFALYKDIDPENWANDGLASHSIVSSLLGGGNTETHDTFKIPSDYEVDKPEISRRVPLIISETDASQFSAIVDVMDGKNLVIEGPPGTGKSQTITNLIAAALAKGKTVLFVAEKMAAVEVVRDRLDAVGLRDFCLEIHSTNKPKVDVYKEIKARCERGDVTQSANPDAIEREYLRNRQQLTDYVELLNQPFGAMGDENKIHTIQEIIWRAKSLHQEFKSANIPDNLLSLSIANPHSLTRFDLDKHRGLLREVIRLQIEIDSTNQDLSIWDGISALDITPIEQEQLIRYFAEWNQCLASTIVLYQKQADIFELPLIPCLGDLKRLDDLIQMVPELQGKIEPHLLKVLGNKASISLGRSFLKKHYEFSQLSQVINNSFQDEELLSINTEKLQDFISTMQAFRKERNLNDAEVDIQTIDSQLLTQLEKDNLNFSLWRRIYPSVEKIQDTFKISHDLTIENIISIGNIIEFVSNTPNDVLLYRNSVICNPENRRIIDQAISVQKQMTNLQEIVCLDLCQDVSKLRQCSQQHKNTRHRNRSLLEARKFWKSIRNSKQNLSDLEVANILDAVAKFWGELISLRNNTKIAEIYGSLYKELLTDFSIYYQINDFIVRLEELASNFPYAEGIKDFILNSPIDVLKNAIAHYQSYEFQQFLQETPKLLLSGISANITLSEVSLKLKNRKQASEKNYQDLCQINLQEDLSLQQLRELVLQLDNYNYLQEELESPLFTSIFGSYSQSPTFSLEALEGSLNWAELLQKIKLPKNLKQQCLSNNVVEFIVNIKSFASEYSHLCQKQEDCYKAAIHLGKINTSVMFGHQKIADCNATTAQDRIQFLNQLDSLQRYLSYSQVKAEIKSANLWNFVDVASSCNLNEEQLDYLYRTIFYLSLVSEIHKKHDSLRLFKGEDQLIARQKFQKLDREILNLYQTQLATQLNQNQIPEGNGRGLKSTWTEKALINNEVNKQKNFVPLRRLFRDAGKSLQFLHPCWMMSPASVAQFLPSNSIRFDLIVIDEASQMRPEEALGVMARGKQLIVVGDPKQLPPTSFFRSADQVDESEDVDAETLQEESVLDMAMKTFSVRRLKWHYRSRHESLIAFSNKHFYDNSLTVFPSPNRKFAINYHHITEGIYQSNVNPIEASKVAEAILEFMKNSPDLSLGVVTLNQKQRDLLQDEMSLLVNNHPEVADYIAKWETTLSSFFIKNLENVQGDERDVIFISTVYGRERPELPVAQRFGPINLANGHRRLNVLFTRAKERIEVFSSMTAADIRPTEASNRGVHALRNYLEYIQTQQLETARLTGREPDSDFEIFVAKAIRAKGFEVVAQVGVANYFIDLAIVDPNRSGTYLLGIECDGATYHSSKAARDRDRYRQEVLEKLGWKLYRIWSTDWFKNPEREIEKLLEAIDKIVKPTSNLP
jgi:very-short-patch-repair endonuclease/DNA polymerase III delta prime subunit